MSNEEILDFLNDNIENESLKLLLSHSDTRIIRLLEDLIDVLIRKNIILLTDFPEKAQEKIIDRKRIREKVSSQNLVVDEIL